MIEDIEKEFFNDVGEEIARRTSRRKAINSKKKGNRGEREAKDILNERFKGLAVFSRTPMSGAYVGGANREKKDYLTEAQKEMMTSDIFCNNSDFKFSIEHKNYKKEKATIWEFFNDKSDLHSWMEQNDGDAASINKEPMLIVKYDNHKRIVFVPFTYLNSYYVHHAKVPKLLPVFMHRYKCCFWLDDLLTLPDNFFFGDKK